MRIDIMTAAALVLHAFLRLEVQQRNDPSGNATPCLCENSTESLRDLAVVSRSLFSLFFT